MRPVFLFNRPTLLLCLTIVILWLGCGQASAAAPITPSGLNTQVTQSGQTYDITGGTRPSGGTNLFHSFGDFNVPNNNIANFLNSGSVDLAGNPLAAGLPTSNILGRVTGGNISNIFGTIQTTGFGNANLFLMNPTGFLFGPHATVNVGGMVAFTAADYLRLAGGVLFNASPNPAADALLSAAPVAAFGFLGSNPGLITVQGSQLSVTPRQSISLVGGNITVQSGVLDDGTTVQPALLSALGGRINLASVASHGEILAGTLAQAPNIDGQHFGALGSIQISQQSVIDVSGNGGGTVLIRGGQFLLDNSTISANVTGPGPVTNGVELIGGGIDIQVNQNAVIQNLGVLETNVTGNATPGVTYGGVHVKADRIEIVGVPDIDNLPFTGIRSDVSPGSTGGNSGDIILEANSIAMRDIGQLEAQVGCADASSCQSNSSQGGAGDAGSIKLTADQKLDIDLSIIQTNTVDGSTGNAGNIELTSTNGNIAITTSSQITSQTQISSGNSGTITVSAPHGDILLSDTVTVGNSSFQGGALGGVQVNANNLQVHGGSQIVQNNFTDSPNPPGDITVTLSRNLSLNDGSTIFTNALSATPAANLNITAHDITIASGSILTTGSQNTGHGGVLNISADTIQMTTGGQIQSGSTIFFEFDPGSGTFFPVPPSGPGGTINIHGLAGPAASVMIDGAGSGIITKAEGTGAAGNTNITAQSVTIQNGGTISASTSGTASRATGGSISVNTTDGVTMTNDALITASSTGPGNANAGNILINAGQQLEMRDSSITTTATKASGGNIDIQAVDRVRLVNSPISTTVHSGAGSGGNITIDPNVVVLLNSPITAQADRGAGGNITITTPLFLPDSSSPVSASSERGVNGTVTIQSPNAPASGHIQPLDKSPLQATSLLNQRCASLAGGEFSSFTVAGRDSLPTEPGGWLASPLATLDAGMGLGAKAEGVRPVARGDGLEGDAPILSLREIARPGS